MMKKRTLFVKPLMLVMFLGGLPGAGAATTAVQTISFSSSSLLEAGAGLEDSFFMATARSLDGFTKFDPSLGTLTNIFLSVEVDVSLRLELIATELDPPDAGTFTVRFESVAPNFVRTGIIYNSSDPGRFLNVTSDEAIIPTIGVIDALTEDFDFDPDFGDGFFEETTINFGGFANGGTTLATGSIDPFDLNVDISDFVGTGLVTGLRLRTLARINAGVGFTVENINNPFLGVESRFQAGNATLQFVFTPIPEPSSAALVLLAALGLAARRRRR